jgi:hypothetical protein
MTETPMRIRKPLASLTAADLLKYPVWEFVLDEEGMEDQDETTLKPVARLGDEEGDVVVRSKFIGKDGTEYIGFLNPIPAVVVAPLDFGFIQPVIVTDAGQVGFWGGIFPWKENDLEKSYRHLGKKPEEVFPIQFATVKADVGYDIQGEISGFMQLVRKKTGFFSKSKEDVLVTL